MANKKEIDQVTGVETTGHVWDGDLKELNKPLPKWWLNVFYVTVIWSIGYWIAYPAWPTLNGYTQGVLGYSERQALATAISEAKAQQAKYVEAIAATPLADIIKNEQLMPFVTAGGEASFGNSCAPCHGRGAQGAFGYPNLNDDDWLWGGSLETIERTIAYGIRSGHKDSHDSAMPRFGIDKILTPQQIGDVTMHVLSLSGRSLDAESADRGKAIFAEQCTACHGEDGKGNQELGAPNLTDGIWLFGGNLGDVEQTIRSGRGGVMPYWTGRLSPETIKMLTVYVHSLGGGKK